MTLIVSELFTNVRNLQQHWQFGQSGKSWILFSRVCDTYNCFLLVLKVSAGVALLHFLYTFWNESKTTVIKQTWNLTNMKLSSTCNFCYKLQWFFNVVVCLACLCFNSIFSKQNLISTPGFCSAFPTSFKPLHDMREKVSPSIIQLF